MYSCVLVYHCVPLHAPGYRKDSPMPAAFHRMSPYVTVRGPLPPTRRKVVRRRPHTPSYRSTGARCNRGASSFIPLCHCLSFYVTGCTRWSLSLYVPGCTRVVVCVLVCHCRGPFASSRADNLRAVCGGATIFTVCHRVSLYVTVWRQHSRSLRRANGGIVRLRVSSSLCPCMYLYVLVCHRLLWKPRQPGETLPVVTVCPWMSMYVLVCHRPDVLRFHG